MGKHELLKGGGDFPVFVDIIKEQILDIIKIPQNLCKLILGLDDANNLYLCCSRQEIQHGKGKYIDFGEKGVEINV